jgi:hypothetical protein
MSVGEPQDRIQWREALLWLTKATFNAIKGFRHGAERPEGTSRTTHSSNAANFLTVGHRLTADPAADETRASRW